MAEHDSFFVLKSAHNPADNGTMSNTNEKQAREVERKVSKALGVYHVVTPMAEGCAVSTTEQTMFFGSLDAAEKFFEKELAKSEK